jgi:hypothetical protein
LREGAIRFKVCSSYAHHPNPKRRQQHYAGQVDYFAIYCPETAGVYLVPIDDLPPRWQAALRVDPPRNQQRLRIRMAADYQIAEIKAVPSRTTGELRGRAGGSGSCA